MEQFRKEMEEKMRSTLGLQKKIKGGIRMIGVRVTLLDGTGAVLDFATSKLSISES